MNDKNMTNTDVVPILPPAARLKILPTLIARVVSGARVVKNFRGNKDVVCIEDGSGAVLVSRSDYDDCEKIIEKVSREYTIGGVLQPYLVLAVRDRAFKILESMSDHRAGKKGIVMLRDSGGCGYWRMILPARYMDKSDVFVDITGGALLFDQLLEYDTIFVQRLHDWDSFYVLERLKQAGKRIVYDIDDDLFSIPDSNPASAMMGRGEQMAAVSCMKLADVITTTTDILQSRLSDVTGRTDIEIVPNSIFTQGWNPTPFTGSSDGWFRIFWTGSSTHERDWEDCLRPVISVMRERKNVRITILGYLPLGLREDSSLTCTKGRIEYLNPVNPEAYFQLIKHIKADVGLAPLKRDVFNAAKSPIKWIENSMVGVPTIASAVEPYSSVITHGETGLLCSNHQEWKDAILSFVDGARLGKPMIEASRRKIVRDFNIETAARRWKEILLG